MADVVCVEISACTCTNSARTLVVALVHASKQHFFNMFCTSVLYAYVKNRRKHVCEYVRTSTACSSTARCSPLRVQCMRAVRVVLSYVA